LWRLFRNQLQSGDNLRKKKECRQQWGEWLCPFCREEEASLVHSLFWCKLTLDMWHICYKWCGVQGVFPSSIKEHYLQHVLVKERKKASDKWVCVWIGVL